MSALEKKLKRMKHYAYSYVSAISDSKHSNVKLSRKTLSSLTTKPITFFYISMHNSSVFVFTTLKELTCHRSQGIIPTYLYLSSAHLIWSIQPPHVQTEHGYYASSADRKQGTGKLKSKETKEVAGE